MRERSADRPAFDSPRRISRGCPRGLEVAREVDAQHVVPLVGGHVRDHAVAQDAGVVDQHVEVAELGERLGYESRRAVLAGDVAGVRHRLAPEPADLLDCLVGGGSVCARTIGSRTQVVHDDASSL